MKNVLSILFVLFLFFAGSAQHSRDAFFMSVTPAITKEKLAAAVNAFDFAPVLPGHLNSVVDIVSVDITAINKGSQKSSAGKDAILTADQVTLLQNADLYSEIEMKIWFRWKDTSAAQCYRGLHHIGDIRYVVVPQKEAEFPGGYSTLKNYVEQNITSKIRGLTSKKEIPSMEATFTVDENGKITEVKVSGKKPSPEAESLILDAINRMPDWDPAQDSNGTRIKQVFTFNTSGGFPGRGC
jgi:hypothetical protein